ncbi:hypothetical protein A3709_19470 [Halioglobus sp. HI00S01]|uniref:hypothetical protein n=1 Tax=Halioglobus sp. HI00S01 TaxID=1822214 RepID=UPI0007C36E56|nr:hypothetical protein [Halioglobus sp. HI00S01]KZX57805.1 hypothetical protein A3709_19470 [Halioglobus sp. HI00S01]
MYGDTNNEDRAIWAENAIGAAEDTDVAAGAAIVKAFDAETAHGGDTRMIYGENDEDLQDLVTDFLCDLGHYCDEEGQCTDAYFQSLGVDTGTESSEAVDPIISNATQAVKAFAESRGFEWQRRVDIAYMHFIDDNDEEDEAA